MSAPELPPVLHAPGAASCPACCRVYLDAADAGACCNHRRACYRTPSCDGSHAVERCPVPRPRQATVVAYSTEAGCSYCSRLAPACPGGAAAVGESICCRCARTLTDDAGRPVRACRCGGA